MKKLQLMTIAAILALLTGLGWFARQRNVDKPVLTNEVVKHISEVKLQKGTIAEPRKTGVENSVSESSDKIITAKVTENEPSAMNSVAAKPVEQLPEDDPFVKNPSWPRPRQGKVTGKVLACRTLKLPPKEKGGGEGELREWLMDGGENYPSHLEEEYYPDEDGELILTASKQYAANQVLVRLDGETSYEDFKAELENNGAIVKPPMFKFAKGAKLVAVKSPNVTLDTVCELQESVKGFNDGLDPQFDMMYSANLTPNDTKYSLQWSHPKTSAPSAWGVRTDASSVLVAVVDTGINYTHEDLAGNMWRNPNPGEVVNELLEITSFSGDTYGIKCIGGQISSDPKDDNGHGSHCAGIIGGVGNNSKGVAGVAWKSKLMAVKVLDSSGSVYVSDAYIGWIYAALNGAKIISCSFGGYGSDSTSAELMSSFADMGVIVVSSSGNDAKNTDVNVHWPSSIDADNMVSVAATDSDDYLCTRARNGWSGGSNYGVTSVDIGAPGDDIWSCSHSGNSAYACLSGTSMACPYVSGTLALIWAKYPNETYKQIIDRLYANGDAVADLNGKVKTGKRVNVYKPLTSSPISAPTGVTASRGTYSDRVIVGWSAVSGATHYHVYRATSSSGSKTSIGSWQTGTSYTDTGVTPGTTYYYWVAAATSSSGANMSAYSASANGYAQAPVRDGWDPGDDTASGGTTITPSTSVQTHGTHTLSASDHYDFFKISMSAGRTYTLESSGSTDTYGELFNSTSANASDRVAYNDDGGDGNNFKLTYNPAVSGIYYLRVRCYSVGNSASYTLKYSVSASAGDNWDPADNTASGGTVLTATSSVQTHGAHTLGDGDVYDFFKIAMTAGRTYEFESTSLTGDVYGELFNSTSTNSAYRVAYNDDGGVGLNFKITYTPSASGTYYLRVRSYNSTATARYTLKYGYSITEGRDIVFCSFGGYKNWPSGQGAFISLSTNDLSNPVTQFTTDDTVYLYHGWSEWDDQPFEQSMTNFITITSANSTNVLAWCENSWVGGIEAGLTGNPWELDGFPAGVYVATFKLNENRYGRRSITETNYVNNIRTITFTVVEPSKTLSMIDISGNARVESKGSVAYECIATYSDRSTGKVAPTWSITSGSAYASIDESGRLTAESVTGGEVQVVISAVYGGKSATKTVTILPEGTSSDIESPFGHVVQYPSAPMIVEAVVSINGVTAEAGDEVAAFCGSEERGNGIVAVGGRLTMPVYIAENGELISFKVWDRSEGDSGMLYPCVQKIQGSAGGQQGTSSSPISLDAASNDPFGDVTIEPTVPTIIEARIKIDGADAAAGDVLGVFAGETLVGKQVISYGSSGDLGDRSGERMAYCQVLMFFSGRQTLTFKVWDASESALLDCPEQPQVTAGDVLGSQQSRYLVEATTFNEDNTPCDVSLPKSGWNLVSFSVLPASATPDEVFAPVKNAIQYVTSGTSIWTPSSNSGNLTQIRIGDGYWVKRTSAEAAGWTVEGTGAPDTEIQLVQGWNLIGYTLPRAGSTADVLASALASGRVGYIVSGSSIYPGGNLNTMAPGNGYWVRASAAYTLKFDRTGMMSSGNSANAMHALANRTYGPFGGESDVIVNPGVPTILSDVAFSVYGKALAVGDCVALFDKDTGDMYAVAQIEDEDSRLTIPVFANRGVDMHFRIWNHASGLDTPEIFEADASSDFTSPTQGDELTGLSITVSGDKPVYRVAYDLDGKATRTGGGALVQNVPFGESATDPLISCTAGYRFREWDHSKRDDIRSEVTFTALYDEVEICLHTSTHREGEVAATCTTAGATGDLVCDNCGEVIENSRPVAALGHDEYISTSGYPATTETEGLTDEYSCHRCGEVTRPAEIIPALDDGVYEPGRLVTIPAPEYDGEKPPKSWAAKGLPTGLKIDSKTGVVSGTPTKPGTYSCTITMTDTAGGKHEFVQEIEIKAWSADYATLDAYGWYDDIVVITGNGEYLPGGKVSLKASCTDKRAVFLGWFDEDWQKVASTASYSFTMPNGGFSPCAYYILPEDDCLFGEDESVDESYLDLTAGENYENVLIATFYSESEITFAFKGVPSGMKTTVVAEGFERKIYLSGKPTSKKNENCRVTISARNKTGWKYTLLEIWTLNGGAEILWDEIIGDWYATGEKFDYAFDADSAPKSVSGLPKGLAYDAKSGVISGFFTTPGFYDVKYVYNYETVTMTAVVRDGGPGYLHVEGDSVRGTLGGAGVYSCGETIKLSAKANKGYVFAGWLDDEGEPMSGTIGVDYRTPAPSVVASWEVLGEVFTGAFVPTAEDAAVALAIENGSVWYDGSGDFAFDVSSASLPKMTLKGAPKGVGVKFVSGITYALYRDGATAIAPGTYPIAITAVNQSKASATATVNLIVPNWTSTEVGEVYDREFVAGLAVEPFEPGDNPEGLTVKGLPSGLKYNAKADAKKGVSAGTISGTPAKAGYFTVTFSRKIGTETYSATATYYVREDLTLKFDGLDGETFAADCEFELNLGERLDTVTEPKITVSGLPTGLKYDAKTLTITGTPTKPGVYTVKASATNYSVKKATEDSTATFTIVVANLRSGLYDDVIVYDGAYPLTVGVYDSEESHLRFPVESGAKVSVSGLPAGVKFAVADGEAVFTGVPTKAGTYTVTITTTIKNMKYVDTITLSVKELPTWATGTFQGSVVLGAEIGGLVDFTVGASGKISGKANIDGKAWTFAATSYTMMESGDLDSCYAVGTAKCGKEVAEFSLYVYDGGCDGYVGDYNFVGYRNQWKDADSAAELKKVFAEVQNAYKERGEKNVTALSEDGLTLKLANTGAVTISGTLDGYKVSASATLLDAEPDFETPCIAGEVIIYIPPKVGKFAGYSVVEFVSFE